MPVEAAKLAALRIDREPERPSAGRRGTGGLILALVLLLGAAGAVAWWWLSARAPEVRVSAARSVGGGSAGAAASVLDASGYVVARRLATISSKVTGRIAEVLIEEGMEVARDQVLARLDDSTSRAQVALARSQLESAQSSLQEVEVRRAEAVRNRDRTRSLRERGLTSVSDLERTEAETDALAARLSALQGEIAVAQKSLALRQQDLDDLVIRAPFAGVVVSKDAQPGEMISPISAGGGFTRTGICTIVDMDSREIEVDVNEAFINRVSDAQRTVARLDAYPDWEIPSSVINIVPTADRQRATVRVRIAFDELDPRILPDMGVRVRFLETAAPGTVDQADAPRTLVPRAALRKDGASDIVWVVSDGMLERRAVRTGASLGEDIAIEAGVRPGERVLTDGPAELAEGQRVSVLE